jgi:SAM-dependent methyltransferase
MGPPNAYQSPALYDLHTTMTEDIPFWLELAEEAGGPVLELAAGTGRIAIPLAQAGHEVTALDVSAAMIKQGKRKAEGAGVAERIHWVQADMCNFELEGRFALIFVPFNSFMLATTFEAQKACLRQAHKHLAPGGKFVLAIFNPDFDKVARREEKRVFRGVCPWPERGSVAVVFSDEHRDPFEQVVEVDMVFEEQRPDGSVQEHSYSFGMRWLFRWEAQLLLERCGFSIVDVFGNYDRSPLTGQSPMMLFVCQRARAR